MWRFTGNQKKRILYFNNPSCIKGLWMQNAHELYFIQPIKYGYQKNKSLFFKNIDFL